MRPEGISEERFRAEQSEIVKQLEAQITEKERLLEAYKAEHGKLELFFKRIEDVIRPVVPLKKVYNPKVSDRKGSPLTAVMHVSDGHMGQVQPADEIEGFGEYGPDLCRSRQIDYSMRTNAWVDKHRKGYTIDECVIIDTGDKISGDIHGELRVTNAFPVPVQCVKAAEVLVEQVSLIASNFGKVTVHFLVEDNHARLTKKPQATEAGYNSLNYVVGKHAKLYLKDTPNVEFNIYPQYEKVITAGARQYLIAHGHGIRGWMGIPWYSIERQVGKESTARLQLIMEDINRAKEIGFHKYVFGHWHMPFDHPLYSCCGSVSGTTAYDHKAGRYAKPSQSAWLIHPRKGEFDRTNFQL
jgi:hypothetical protein